MPERFAGRDTSSLEHKLLLLVQLDNLIGAHRPSLVPARLAEWHQKPLRL